MTFTIPFFNQIGRSIFGSANDAEVKRKKLDDLRNTVYDLNEIKTASESKGWKALQKRCDDKIAALQALLESAKPDELALIQKQIRVLRDVTDISADIDMLEAAQNELKELVDE